MARTQIQLPTDGAGKSVLAFDFTEAGAPAPNAGVRHAQGLVVCDANGNAASVSAAGRQAVDIVGAPQTTAAGTVTTAASVVGGATDYGTANNVTATVDGTYAGVNMAFEVSDDGGVNWYMALGQRTDTGVAEPSTGVLPANTRRAWSFSMQGFNRFRVRATAWTSGVANVDIDPGSMPFAPVVTSIVQSPPRTLFAAVTAEAGIALTTVGALQTLFVARSGGAMATATSVAITPGKTLRIQAVTLGLNNGATAAALRANAHVRYNPTGATVAGSSSVASMTTATVGATAQMGAAPVVVTPAEGIDLAGGTAATFGVTIIGSAAGGLAWVGVTGYEY